MKKLLFFAALFLPLGLGAQALQEAEDAYQKNDFAQSLKIYQQLLPTMSGDALYTTQLRIIANQHMLGEFQNAAESAFTFPLPESPVWKARFLLYRIYTADSVKNIYDPLLNDADEDDAPLSRLSREQWNDKINESFEALWALRTHLINAPISQETLILDIEDTDQKAIPTLFDFVVMKWQEKLMDSSSSMPIAARRVLTLKYQPSVSSKDNAEKLLDILAEAARLEGKNREDARIIWQTKLLVMPFEESRFFTFADKKAERAEAIRLLNALSGYEPQKKSWLDKLTRALSSTANADYGKAFAALQAAQMLNQDKEYAQAVQICDWAVQKLQASFYTQSCAELAVSIRKPVLTIKNTSFSQDPAEVSVPFKARNADTIYARIFEITEQDLYNWYRTEHRSAPSSWRYLTDIPHDQIPQLLFRKPLTQTEQKVSYAKQYGFTNDSFRLPMLKKRGFYAVVFSYDAAFKLEKAPVQAVVINNTDLALFASAAIEGNPADYDGRSNKTFNPGLFRIYTLNLKTGEPVAGADITYFTDYRGSRAFGKTNENGLLTISRAVRSDRSSSYLVEPKAVKDASTAFTTYPLNFYYNPPQPYRLFAETDRAIYRPGQKVRIAVYGFEQAGRGLKTMPQNSAVTLTVRNANYEKVLNKTLTLNDYGAAQDELTLPQTGLLGRYQVQVTYKYGRKTTSGSASFQVDEYKRPEYEVTLSDQAQLQFGKETRLQGKALYYFGAPVDNATVKYTVRRSDYYPPFWWWRIHRGSENKLLTEGETSTDKDGVFYIPFTPEESADPAVPSQFTVNVQVFDASGRVIEENRTYKASRQSIFFQASFDKGFYDANTPSALATVALTDVNGAPEEGKFTAEIFELENKRAPEKREEDYDEYDYAVSVGAVDAPSGNLLLEKWFGKNKEIRRVLNQNFTVKKGEKTPLRLPALPEGVYKLKLQNKNAETTELVFLVAAQNSKLDLPDIAIAQHETYYPGTQAKLLIGAASLSGAKRVEVYQNGQFLAARELLAPGVSIYNLPIQEAWRGGVYVRWFGASNYKVYDEGIFVHVPHDNKALAVTLQTPEAVKPGEKVNWTLTAKNAFGAPVQGLASVRVYDKALDYYAKPHSAFSLDTLYPTVHNRTGFNTSGQVVSSSSYGNVRESSVCDTQKTCFDQPYMPQLNLQMHYMEYAPARGMDFGAYRSAAPAMAMKQAYNSVATDLAPRGVEAFGIEEEDAAEADSAGAETDKAAVRSDFSETAYFNPLLPLQGGKASLRFTMPQSLTAWNIMGFALTKGADFGSFTAQTLTRKDISVRLSLPRFWREGDQSVIVAQVTNLSSKKQTAEVTLDLLLGNKDMAARFGIAKRVQSVTVNAGRTASVQWPITAPQSVGIFSVTATVRAGADTDAERREIPLLPAKERIAESVTVALDSSSQTLKLENLLKPDPTREVSAVTLRVDPGLLLSVFNAMPQLLKPRYEDALSVSDRYVPLSVVNAFYKKYPMLQTAVTKLPKRNTQTPAWNDNQDPARLMLLEETPWLQTSRGGATREEFLTDLFNPAAVKTAREKAEKELAKYQTASGGYSWMKGGEASEYITLSILSSYAEALRYGADIPQDAAKKALSWLAPRIEKELTNDQPSAYEGTLAFYAAYVYTAFPQSWAAVKEAPVQKWLDYADKHSAYMTALGQTYAAAAYYRLGQDTKAQNYMDLVLSRMKSDPVTGSYFAPEAQSWLWYNDTLATQTATLRTLLEVRPESDKAQGLVKWLLFNRKAQAWRSTTATANAIYALLDYMQRHGLLDDPAEYTLRWGAGTKQLHFEPFDWSEKLSWTQEAKNVPAQYYTAQVTKRGGLTGFVTLDAVYTTANAAASPEGVMNVSRRYLLKYIENGRDKVRELQPGETVPVGSEVEVQLTINTSSAFDFVVLSDPKPAGFENTELLSGWSWDVLSVYREYKDAVTNFFINRVPAGTYTLRYTLRPTLEGQYHALPAQMQSMYAPEFSAHTAAGKLEVNAK